MSSSKASSSIKGGGRVELAPELEDEIVDLLQSRRNPKHPLLPASGREQESSTSRRRFLKRLIESHERHVLSVQLNQVSLVEEPTAASSQKKSTGGSKSSEASSGGKVRFDLMEAVYKSPEKWKVGSTKKTIVLDRSTPIATLLKQAKDKLKMKKKALRCFYVDRKIELELTNNLEGLQDGATLYVTSQQQADAKKKESDPATGNAVDDVVGAIPDPLDVVKQVYAQRSNRQRGNRVIIDAPIPFGDRPLPDLPDFRAQLPAANFRREILQALDQSRVLILCGATGCGKSTQVPQYIYECSTSSTNIVVTQPRRVAAMALAERVAVEQGSTPPGKKDSVVGYQVRLDAAISDTTRVTYMTVGILLRRLTTPSSSDVPLDDISHLVVDEVHERDINTDFCLTILRRVLVRNPHLKLILMSATNTPDLFYNYFLSEKLGIRPTILQIPGRTFPVESFWLGGIEKMIGQKLKNWSDGDSTKQSSKEDIFSPRATAAIDNAFISRLVFHLVNSKEHASTNPAILIFLPGRGDIEALARTLRYDDQDTECLSIQILHSSVSQANQKAVFQPVEEGKFKCVLATNVAETSITIPSVSIVIDTGRVKESRFNSSARIKELVTVWISQASATQRTGRAGRTRQGYCYRLYTEKFATTQMLKRTTPEILRTPLDELVLQSCLLDEDRKDRQKKGEGQPTKVLEGTVPVDFLGKTPDPPPTATLVDACQHLIEVGALQLLGGEDASMRVQLTPLGYHLSQLPMDAKIGKVLITGSILGCVEPALTAAAALSSTRNIFLKFDRAAQKKIIEDGFGGATWDGGTVKGDCIASIAAYNEWSSRGSYKQRLDYAMGNGLDFKTLSDIYNLRQQFRTCLLDAGFLTSRRDKGAHSENARLTSCCLVAGLYPNVATLMRPVRGKLGFRGGRLLTKDGSVCTPSSQSFQAERLRSVSENGRDAYAVFQSKNRIVGAAKGGATNEPQKLQIFLDEVNFVSRFALLLFGGNLIVKDNFIVVDDWLKFKVGEKGRTTAILIKELRRELDIVFLSQLSGGKASNDTTSSDPVVDMVVKLLQEE